MDTYESSKTALIIVDPFNDFLSEGGKLWAYAKETVLGIGLVKNLKALLSALVLITFRLFMLPIIIPIRKVIKTGNFFRPPMQEVKRLCYLNRFR